MLVIALLALLLQSAAPPQPHPDVAEIKKLEYMTGRWQGEGWMDVRNLGRVKFTGGENVQVKLGGRALLVEGLFRAPGPDGQERVVHETLAVISWDAAKKAYNFRTYTAQGGSGDHELKITGDRAWQWSLQAGPMTIRFSAKFAGEEWHEIGERSSDGQTWTQFFEMKLKRVN